MIEDKRCKIQEGTYTMWGISSRVCGFTSLRVKKFRSQGLMLGKKQGVYRELPGSKYGGYRKGIRYKFSVTSV